MWIGVSNLPVQWIIYVPHRTICVDEGVVEHMIGYEGLTVQVCDPVTQLVVSSGDEASLFTVQVMSNL